MAEEEIVQVGMAEEQELIPLASNVTAHCAGCTCSDGVAATSFFTVGTSLPTSAGSKHSEGSNGAGSGNGHVTVNVSTLGGDDEHLCRPDMCMADMVATNLHELNSGRHEKLRIAFQDWEKKLEMTNEYLARNEARQNALRNEIYQVIGFYIVFQGVLFTAVAGSSLLRCHNWWTSFSLSLLTSLVTVVVVLQKLQHLLALDTTMASEKLTAQVLNMRTSKVLNIGPQAFDFRFHARDSTSHQSKFAPRLAKLYAVTVLTVLLSFSVIFLLSVWRLLCRPGNAIP